MKTEELFGNSTYTDQVHMAEAELSAFMGAVTQLFGSEQARVAAEDWLDESASMDNLARSTTRDWRAVTIAASARLAKRLNISLPRRTPFAASNTKVSAIPSSNCFVCTHLV
jgi:hypothetical protein